MKLRCLALIVAGSVLPSAQAIAADVAMPRFVDVQWPPVAVSAGPQSRLTGADETRLPVLAPRRFLSFRSLRFVGDPLHLEMDELTVTPGQTVAVGASIGLVSNDFSGTATPVPLHFEMKQDRNGQGWRDVPTYTSLVAAYQRM